MKNVNEIIAALSSNQATSLLELAARWIGEHGAPHPIAAEGLPDDPALNRALLAVLVQGEDGLAQYLRRQLLDNAHFLARQREEGLYRDGISSALPYLAVILPFLKARLELARKDGQLSFSLSVEWRSLIGLLQSFGLDENASSRKNVIEDSSIHAGGNIHVGDIIFQQGQQPAAPIPSPPGLKRDVEALIRKALTEKAIELLLETLDGVDGHRYQEVLILSGRWHELKKNERLGLISPAEGKVERNKINKALLELAGEE